jgi:hypothetical protein
MTNITLKLYIKGIATSIHIPEHFLLHKFDWMDVMRQEMLDEDDYFNPWIYELAEMVEKHMGTTFDRFNGSVDILDVDVY